MLVFSQFFWIRCVWGNLFSGRRQEDSIRIPSRPFQSDIDSKQKEIESPKQSGCVHHMVVFFFFGKRTAKGFQLNLLFDEVDMQWNQKTKFLKKRSQKFVKFILQILLVFDGITFFFSILRIKILTNQQRILNFSWICSNTSIVLFVMIVEYCQ